MAKWLALSTLDYEVPGSNPIGNGIQPMTVKAFHCTEPFIMILPLSQYDPDNVERDVKHQIIITTLKQEKESLGHMQKAKILWYPIICLQNNWIP